MNKKEMLLKNIQILSIIIAYLVSLNFNINEAACANKPTCLHLGQWSETTCACQCLPGYSGAVCEFGNCNIQSADCTSLPIDLCSDQLIFNYCPKKCDAPICKCGFDTCLNGGTFNPTSCSCTCMESFSGYRCNTTNIPISTTTTTTTTTKTTTISASPTPCPRIFNCQNGGVQNSITCKCDCLPAYEGESCEILRVNSTTTIWTTSTATKLTSPTTTATSNVKCYFGFIFDLSTSKCNCDIGFSGSKCEYFDCSSNVEDDADICPESSCDVDEIKRFCPNKCFCPKKPACLPCYNNGRLDANTCSCSCPANYIGKYCQYAKSPCEYQDPAECASIDCWNTDEKTFFKCQRKCLCCGNKKCGPLGIIEVDANGACKCKCKNDNFDASKGCAIKETCEIPDLTFCGGQIKNTDCGDSFVNSTCPIMCRACKEAAPPPPPQE